MEREKEEIYALEHCLVNEEEGRIYVSGDIVRVTKDGIFIDFSRPQQTFSISSPDSKNPSRSHLDNGSIFVENSYYRKEIAQRQTRFERSALLHDKCSKYVDIVASGMLVAGIAAIPVGVVVGAIKIINYFFK